MKQTALAMEGDLVIWPLGTVYVDLPLMDLIALCAFPITMDLDALLVRINTGNSLALTLFYSCSLQSH